MPFYAGRDFDLLETRYVFDNETSEHSVGIIVHDDHIVGAEERFELYFPTLTGSNEVQLLTQTSPNSVTVIIQDNEGKLQAKK